MRDQTQLKAETVGALRTVLHPGLQKSDTEFMVGIFERLVDHRPVSAGHVDDILQMMQRVLTVEQPPTEPTSTSAPTEEQPEMDAEELVAPSQSPLLGDLLPRCVQCYSRLVPIKTHYGFGWKCSHPDCDGDVS